MTHIQSVTVRNKRTGQLIKVTRKKKKKRRPQRLILDRNVAMSTTPPKVKPKNFN